MHKFRNLLLKALIVFVAALFQLESETAMLYSSNWKVADLVSFKPSEGDYLVVDVEENIGYLLNDFNKTVLIFPVLSGQKRNVCYLGKCYYAATPKQKWIVEEEDIQSDRITFSASGEFLRLFENGEKRTSYGIHGYKYFKDSLENGKRFISMGCILVDDNVLDVIQKSYIANKNSLNVLTTDKLDISVALERL